MRFRTGLVIGKFSPLHRGHQFLIDSALRDCDEVVVLSYAKPAYDRCDPSTRRHWLRSLYPQVKSLVVDDAWLAERSARGLTPFDQVPDDSEPEDVHRRFTAWLCQGVIGETCDAVFTSEEYGDGFAHVLTEVFGTSSVTHICVDPTRQAVPVSATAIRSDASLREKYLSPVVKASFVPRLVLLGAESTGKSVLARALSERWDEPLVEEYGRELWLGRSGRLTFEDLLHIAEIQIEREELAAMRARRLVVCDTSPLTTLFYSLAMFGRSDPRLEALAERPYDHVLLCQPDFPLVQDGTRQDESFRRHQHAWYVEELSKRAIRYRELSGDHSARLEQVTSVYQPKRPVS